MSPFTVTLVDYGAGNVASVVKGFEAVGAAARVTDRPGDLTTASAVVVPGVGHFDVTRTLGAAWRDAVLDAVQRKVPLLGICVGMQWLFEGSDEAPDLPGLGLFEGRCSRIPEGVKVPHVGWNTLEFTGKPGGLLESVATGAYAYFTHSFAAPVTKGVVATTAHGERFAAVAERRRVCGVQFHPEKSGRTGLTVLRNFVALAQNGG